MHLRPSHRLDNRIGDSNANLWKCSWVSLWPSHAAYTRRQYRIQTAYRVLHIAAIAHLDSYLAPLRLCAEPLSEHVSKRSLGECIGHLSVSVRIGLLISHYPRWGNNGELILDRFPAGLERTELHSATFVGRLLAYVFNSPCFDCFVPASPLPPGLAHTPGSQNYTGTKRTCRLSVAISSQACVAGWYRSTDAGSL